MLSSCIPELSHDFSSFFFLMTWPTVFGLAKCEEIDLPRPYKDQTTHPSTIVAMCYTYPTSLRPANWNVDDVTWGCKMGTYNNRTSEFFKSRDSNPWF